MSFISEITATGVGSLMGGVGQLAKDIREAWTGDIPAEKKAEIEQKLLELENAAMQAQTEVNKVEAASEHWFVAGWRPFVGWVCGFALFYSAIVEPFMTWCAVAYGLKDNFPALDTTITMQILFGMLGIGAMRSFDRKQAPAPAGKE